MVMPGCRAAYAWACSAVGSDDASDIAQESLRRLWERRDELRTLENVAAYAMMIARNLVVDLLRERQRLVRLDSDVAGKMASDPDLAGEKSEERKLLRKMLAMLPENQRVVVRLSLVAGMSNSEIAAATGLSPDVVRQSLSRGRKRLKELYKAAMR